MNAEVSALLGVALGGAIGGALRHIIAVAVATKLGHPVWGTFVVNLTGSFFLGVVAAALDQNAAAWLFLSVGLIGSYTTVSSFSLQTLTLIQQRRVGFALLNIALSVVLCVVSAAAGFTLAEGVV